MLRILLILIMFALPAWAEGPKGIAFVQAPEQSWGVGLGQSASEAIGRAVAQCVDGGAMETDCLVTNYCSPAGWSVDFFIQHTEGPHWHEVICGLAERSIAEALEAQICDTAKRPWLMECALVQIYDPDGLPQREW